MDSRLMLIFLTAIILHIARCERRCKTDGECADLGDLICIKTSCDVGLCGCKRGYASRFVGYEFKCVKIKKIGEKCSSGSDGTCGAGSCIDGKCACVGGEVAHFGGTYCSSVSIAAGETGSGNLASCLDGTLEFGAPWTCTCPTGQKVVISYNQGNIPFTGGKVPTCRDIQIGEFCIDDADCGGIRSPDGGGGWTTGAAACTNNVCQCPGSNVADITGLYCAPALGVGTACSLANSAGVCPGSDGLTCGDECDAGAPTTCVCDPGWNSAGTCSKKFAGDPCFGDRNCKSINDLAVCVDGYCEESSAAVINISFILSLATFIMHFVV